MRPEYDLYRVYQFTVLSNCMCTIIIYVIKESPQLLTHNLFVHGCFEMDIRLLIRKRMYITVQFLSGSHRSSLKCGQCSNPYFVKMRLP